MKYYRWVVSAGVCLMLLGMSWANDSSYYTSGDQLVPLQETEIAVKKEVLTISRTDDDKVAIVVDYVFHHAGKEAKTLLMGFEAGSPMGDVDGTPRDGGHPYIHNFTVVMNQNAVKHQVAIYDLEEDKKPKVFKEDDLAKHNIIPRVDDPNVTNFCYVYYFTATFQPGDNSVKHTYEFDISSGVFTEAEIEYLLSPALRWANKKIDDFTLIVDMGERQEYHLSPNFFESAEEWKCEGKVKAAMENVKHAMSGETSRMLTVWQEKGSIRFHAKDFQPKGEFHLLMNRGGSYDEVIDVRGMRLPYGRLPWFSDCGLRDEFSRKVLRNLPYAQRGYVFRDAKLREYYAKQPWYRENQELGEVELDEEEIEWRKEVAAMPIGQADTHEE